MKSLLKYSLLFLFAAGVVLTGCQSTGENDKQGGEEVKEQEAKKENKEKKTKNLTPEQKATNVYANTLTIFSGSMALAFNSAFKDLAEGIKTSINEAAGDKEAVNKLDAKIAELPDEISSKLQEMTGEMNKGFTEMKKTNPEIYNKMFKNELMQEGIDITTKYDLPEGFKPLSENLNEKEIKRYIVFIGAAGNDQANADHPVIKTYQDLFAWFQKMGKELQKDPDIKAYMEEMKQKQKENQ